MSDLRRISVTFRRQISDGNFGSETAEITLEGWADEAEDEDAVADGLLMAARRYVQRELTNSPNPRVRAAMTVAEQKVPVPHAGDWR